MDATNTLNDRLLELVQDYGGPSKAANDLLLPTPQIFYNLRRRPDSKPNSETIEKVFSLVPNANANWLYRGVGPKYLTPYQMAQPVGAGLATRIEEVQSQIPALPAPAESLSAQVLAAENAGLKKEIARLEETVSILRTVVGSQIGKDFEQSKTESSNDTTQGGQLHLDLAFAQLKERRFIPVDIRDAFAISRQWSNPRG